MKEGDAVDSLEEGFRDPPDHVTEPCLTYMARVMELREFISFVFTFVKTSEELGRLVPKEKLAAAEAKELQVLTYNYSGHRSLVNQIMLSRAIESFDLYLITILRDIFLARPEMLKSEGTIDVAAIIDAGNYDDLIWQIVDRKVHELSYKSLMELRKYVSTRTGIDLFPSQAAYEMTVLASEVRNLIAHNDCVVNHQFNLRTKGIISPLEVSDTGRIRIDDGWLRRASYTLDGLVFRFDELASQKFGLHTHFRMGAFLFRG
ncbi:hypothetical protein AB6806_09105 [Bosea sp. RCC_152_1]|uniref:hypothetical protein n=1 Tax=Bosea sp. RCC_152_1 TaxID=3239228 RepID=UPI0035255C4D